MVWPRALEPGKDFTRFIYELPNDTIEIFHLDNFLIDSTNSVSFYQHMESRFSWMQSVSEYPGRAPSGHTL